MCHVHIFPVAPLGTSHMAESSTNQHKGRAALGEGAHHMSMAANLPVETLDHIVGSDPSPMLVVELAVS